MKKIILLALISLFVVSIGVSAADYHIEWFDSDEEISLGIVYKNTMIVHEKYSSSIYTEEGKKLTDKPFLTIYAIDSGEIFSAKEVYFD